MTPQQKLYTKEMFLQAAEKCEVSMIDAKHIIKYIDEYVTPIELPSDENIEKEINSNIYIENDESFRDGARWVINKIIYKIKYP